MVTEGVEPHPACVAADQVAPHGRAVGALRGAGVPALRHRRAHGLEQSVVEQRALFPIVVSVDAAEIVVALVLKRPLGQKVEVVRLLWRVFDLHRQLGLRP